MTKLEQLKMNRVLIVDDMNRAIRCSNEALYSDLCEELANVNMAIIVFAPVRKLRTVI